jgi:flavin reductase
MVNRESYREAMARLGAAVNIITTDGPAGRRGFTASAVCSVTDRPPTLLICMNRDSESSLAVIQNGVVVVNTLAHEHQELSGIFAGQVADTEARFGAATWDKLITGAPVLRGATVSFDCRITQLTEVGTHSVAFCSVEAIQMGEVHEGLIYFARAYHLIKPA